MAIMRKVKSTVETSMITKMRIRPSQKIQA